jgi:cytochrome c
LAPVAYSIIMAFVPEKSTSMSALSNDKTKKDPAKLYEKCAACHGANGDGSDGYPQLNALGKQKLIEMMIGYQTGAKGNADNGAIMKGQLEGLSPSDIQELGEHISKMKPNEKMQKKDDFYKEKKREQELDTTSVSS